MTLYDKSNHAINIFFNDIETIQNHYIDQIKEAIIANDEGFMVYVLSEHIKLLNCINELEFHETILLPIINQSVNDLSMRYEEITAFLNGKVRYQGVF
jgi:hypothetical protein